MRGFIQMVCVFVIAIGAGLLAFSSRLEPQFNLADPATLNRSSMSYINREEHFTASITGGVGIGFMIFGSLGLVIPWVNRLGTAMTGELGDNSSRTITTITIWLSAAVILTFGVFGVSWSGAVGQSVVLLIVTIICATSTLTTAMIWGWRPWMKSNHHGTGMDPQKSP